MNFLQFAVWGAYLTSMGTYLASHGHAENIGHFFSTQGIVSIFMPALIGIIADRWIQAQKVYGICHLICAAAMITLGVYGLDGNSMSVIYPLYFLAIAFYMPSLSMSYAVSYNAMAQNGMDTIREFPAIRTFGTIGFIASMWIVDLMGYQTSSMQFVVSGVLGLMLGLYAFTLPKCDIKGADSHASIGDKLGLKAFRLFSIPRMAVFFIFSALLGVALQITNGYANTFISSFGNISDFADTFGVRHANILISISQISETLCILLIPFFLGRFGIKKVMIIAMLAWVLRFALFGLGNPGGGVWLFVLSCVVYGVAFDFFNISGTLFVNQETSPEIRSSAQGLFMMMNNGIGCTLGMLAAQMVVNHYVNSETDPMAVWQGWQTSWYIFAGYALVLAVAFALIFKYKHNPGQRP